MDAVEVVRNVVGHLVNKNGMKDKRMVLPDRRKYRNLVQYKDMTDEEFDEVWKEKIKEIELSPEILEQLVVNKIEDLGQDYDLEDMKANDMVQLRALALAMIQLEDLEKIAWRTRQETNYESIQILEKINRVLSTLRSDISNISSDLQLTRKIRKQSREASVINAIDDLRDKARRFYRERMLYIFCDSCKMLLCTTWLMYSENEDNFITLECNRCKNKMKVKLCDLYHTDNKNLEDLILP